MKKPFPLSIAIVSLFLALTIFSTETSAQRSDKFQASANGVAGRYIVLLNEKYVDANAVRQTIESEASFLTSVHGGKVQDIFSSAVKGFVVEMSEEAAIQLSQDDRVAYVEQDSETYTSATQTPGSWGIDRIDQRGLPLNNQYSWSNGASNVHAYILDTGIRPTHAEFGGRASADYDALPDGRAGIDCNGHGTHVAGTIGGATFGVAKDVRLHSVRVLPCSGPGLVSHLMMGVDWVTANHIKPAVANISIVLSTTSVAAETAVQSSINAGVTYVIAAGNVNLDACTSSPGRLPGAITVGALNSNDSKAGYSNWGSCVDVWAPGTMIISAGIADDTGSRTLSGTSMAAPHVAGIAALYLASHTNATPSAVSNAITGTSTTNIVTGLDPASPNRTVYSWLDGTPPTPMAGRVTIRKRTVQTTESMPTASFPFSAVNLAENSFALMPENTYTDSAVDSFGTGNAITVTESGVAGWKLKSISCTETSASGGTSVINSTVDLVNKTANIVVEEGEQIECTFTSEPLAPTAANATIAGSVTTPKGRGVRGATITVVDADSGAVQVVTTNIFGRYSVSNLPVGRFYIVTLAGTKGRTFNSPSRAFSLLQDTLDIDFISN